MNKQIKTIIVLIALTMSGISCDLEPFHDQEFHFPEGQVTVLLTITHASEDSVNFKWSINNGAVSKYILKLKTGNDTVFRTIHEASSGTVQYVHTDAVIANLTHFFRLDAVVLNDTVRSNQVYAHIPFYPPAQMMVTNLSASSMRLDWYYYNTIGKGMRVEKRIVPNGEFQVVADQSTEIQFFTDTLMNTSFQYRYKVYSYSQFNVSYADSIDLRYENGQWQGYK